MNVFILLIPVWLTTLNGIGKIFTKSFFLGEDIATRRDFSEATAREIDLEIKKILDEGFAKATALLNEKDDALIKVANGLLEKEELLGEDIQELLGLEPRNNDD